MTDSIVNFADSTFTGVDKPRSARPCLCLLLFSRQKAQDLAAAVDHENGIMFGRNPFLVVAINQKFPKVETLADVSGAIIDFINDALFVVIAKQAAFPCEGQPGSFTERFGEPLLSGIFFDKIIS